MHRIPFFALLFVALAGVEAHAQTETIVRGRDAIRLPEGFHAEIAAGSELTQYPMFMTFDDRGRLFIAEASGKNAKAKEMLADPQCTILLLEDTDHDGRFDTRKVFADHLTLPMGVQWFQGSLYVADPPNFLKLTDADGDGVAEQREVLLSGWNVLNTASLHGPFLGPDGLMYLTHGRHGYKIATKEGETLEGTASRIWRCKPDGTKLERMCGGPFDNPVELIFLGTGETIGTMTYFTDPKNGQRDALMHWVEGGLYPKHGDSASEFIRTGDYMPVLTKFARIAPAGLARYRGANFGEDYRGNLFSAQFNPHRVQRHVLTREGGSFHCEDSDFLTSVDPDFHPTDVLEDADGSMLVSDTGAWYVDACPLSRIAKPDIKGTIFRVVRDAGDRPEDPWGTGLAWDTLQKIKLTALMSDPRPRVRDHAREVLVGEGSAAVPALEALLRSNPAPEVACDAIWALHRIGGHGWRTVREFINAEDAEVRIAACRAVGLEDDHNAVKRLIGRLQDDDFGVRRQAATALGQINAPRTAQGVLDATAGVRDRFVEHALIYALIQMNDQDVLATGLSAEDVCTRKAALIALDQLHSEELTEPVFAPFLSENDDAMRQAVLWVASRHTEWSGAVVGEIDKRLRAENFDPATAAPLRELVLAYAKADELQALVAKDLADAGLDDARKLFLLDLVGQAQVNPLPAAWIAELGKLLDSTSVDLKARVAFLLRTRGVGNFDGKLVALAADDAQPNGMRLTALGAALPRVKTLNEAQFAFARKALAPENAPTERQAAAKILADADLNEAQLQSLTKELPEADALSFPSLLDAFKHGKAEDTGLALVKGLTKASALLERVPSQRLDTVLAGYPEAVQSAAAPLRARAEAEKAARVEKLKAIEPLLGGGDVGRGRRVFFGQKVACYTCHRVGEEGGVLGPDLTSIGAIRSAHDILESVLFPSASIVQDYDTYVVETALDSYQGTIARQEPDAVVLRTAVNEEVRVPRSEITSMQVYPISKMPEGLDQGLTRDELLDLISFLRSLNGEGWLQPEMRNTDKH